MDRILARHFSDPGCPWAYSARPALARLRWRFGGQLDWQLVMIGLSESAAPAEARGMTPATRVRGWGKFERRFGMPFVKGVKPRLWATSRACRAIVAAREESAELGDAAHAALQLMQFATLGLLDDDDDLGAALAGVEGLDASAIVGRIEDEAILAAYEADRARARSAKGRPIHAQNRQAGSGAEARYTAPSVIFETADGRELEVGGFQPFESYDTVLANLDPQLERRPPPEHAAEAVAAFPRGLTTAEVASIMRRSDLEEIDIAATERELFGAVAGLEVTCEPAGSSALWRPAWRDGTRAPA